MRVYRMQVAKHSGNLNPDDPNHRDAQYDAVVQIEIYPQSQWIFVEECFDDVVETLEKL